MFYINYDTENVRQQRTIFSLSKMPATSLQLFWPSIVCQHMPETVTFTNLFYDKIYIVSKFPVKRTQCIHI